MAEGKLNDLNLGQFNRSWGRLFLYPDRGEGGLVLPRSPCTGGLKDCLTEVLSTIYDGGGSSRLLEYMCGRPETLDYSSLRLSEYTVQPIA